MSVMVMVGTAPEGFRLYKDAVAISMPSGDAMGPTGEGLAAAVLTRKARAVQLRQYPNTVLVAIDWVFARTPEEVEAWELPHDCDGCRECKTRGIALLAESDVIICLGTMFCAEPAR